jgi:hypothetical protein
LQPDLFPHKGLNLKPAPGRAEPRLWVRRLIVWREHGKEVRDIELRPGLNVIWSPDDGSQRGQIGHGGGKTTFCRLVRYCLGEDSFGPEAERHAIFDEMPMGWVGAEVRLNGDTWLIRRSFSPHREDHAFLGPSLAEVSDFPAEPNGMQPFREAATKAFLEDALPLMPASIGSDGAWPALLAWMTRDQECRFGHLLDWRSPDSGSRSPVSGRNRPQNDRETVIRIVLNALRTEEVETRRRWEAVNSALSNQRTHVGRLTWQLAQWRFRLAEALGLNTDNSSGLDATIIKAAVTEQLAKVEGLSAPATLDQLRSARSEAERAFKEQVDAQAAIEIASSKKEYEERIAKVIADQLPELSAQNQRLEYPVCPVCGVLIDKARAEGCGISAQSCDLEALRVSVAQQIETREKALAEAARLETQLPTVRGRLALANQVLKERRTHLAAVERAAFDRSQELRRAERTWEWAIEFEQANTELEIAERALARDDSRLRVLGEELESHRSAVADLIGELSERFDAVFREMVPTDGRCSVKLDGNGLGLRVPVDGAAIDSLKVAAFDIAVLSMAIEERVRHPGFLIHDSPREADLGRSIYAGLFALAKKLEAPCPAPLFQYIVTTTTEPPSEFCLPPYLRLKVRGAPVEERLLKANL